MCLNFTKWGSWCSQTSHFLLLSENSDNRCTKRKIGCRWLLLRPHKANPHPTSLYYIAVFVYLITCSNGWNIINLIIIIFKKLAAQSSCKAVRTKQCCCCLITATIFLVPVSAFAAGMGSPTKDATPHRYDDVCNTHRKTGSFFSLQVSARWMLLYYYKCHFKRDLKRLFKIFVGSISFTVTEESLGFGLSVGQKKYFENVTLRIGKL